MKAYVLKKGKLKIREMEEPSPGYKEVLVSLRTAGLNRRDLGIPNRVGKDKDPLILGSDGAGIVEKVGEGATRFKVGDEVMINPSLRWYDNSDAPPVDFDILGMPNHGTFAEKIAISEEQLELKPSHFSWEEAGAFSLAALTAYRSLFTRAQIKRGETIFIPGAGSGVATYLISFAKNVGARVIVSSRSEEKRQKARDLGADITVNTASDWKEELSGERIDLVIDSVGAATFNRSLDVLKEGGRIVIFGATTDDNVDFDLRSFFYGQYDLLGSTMGSRQELQAAIDHMENFATHPVVDRVFDLDDAEEAMAYLDKGNQFGKVVLKI